MKPGILSRKSRGGSSRVTASRNDGPWLALFAALALAVVALVAILHTGFRVQHERETGGLLSAIGSLIAERLADFRGGLLRDGRMLAGNADFVEAAEAALARLPDGAERFAVWARSLVAAEEVRSIHLLRGDGARVACFPDYADMPGTSFPADSGPQAPGEPFIADFYLVAGRPYVAVVVPLPSGGLVAMQLDPRKELGELLHSWPGAGRTAEALVAMRQGERVLLYGTRGTTWRRGDFSGPIEAGPASPAALAFEGARGLVRGVDYRGTEVMADLREVPGSPWFVVTKIDLEEVEAAARGRFALDMGLGGLLVLLAGAGLAAVRRTRWTRSCENQLAAEKEKAWLRRAIERSLEEIYAFDPVTLRCKFANEGALLDTGYSAAEAAELTLSDLAPDLDEADIARATSGDRPGERDAIVLSTRHRRSDGSAYPVECRLQLVDSGDEPVLLAIATDVSERERRERELRERNEELSRFTYTVSHDLKSPLVTIRAFSGYLKRDLEAGDPVKAESDLAWVLGAAEKMSRLLDDLLNLSRIGRRANPPTRSTLGEIAGEALGLVAGRVSERGAKVEIRNGGETMYGDRARLVELLQNLLDNAVKYSRRDVEPRIVVGVERPELRRKPGKGGRVPATERVFYVRDNGIGIDPRHVNRLFGLFEKLSTSGEGTGIGLAVARRIVETHGGRIWVESEGPDRGACFKFTVDDPARASRETDDRGGDAGGER